MTAPPRVPSALTDEHLLEAVRANDDWAYAELYRRYAGEVRRFARTLVAPDDVDELTSESFTRMLGALRHGKGPVDHPVRYLMVTTRTSAISLSQRHRRQQDICTRAGLQGPAVHEETTGADEDLVAAFAQLSPRWRMVLWWSAVEGLSSAEIGERMGVAATTVSAVAYRARCALRTGYLAAAGLDRSAAGR